MAKMMFPLELLGLLLGDQSFAAPRLLQQIKLVLVVLRRRVELNRLHPALGDELFDICVS